MIPEGFRPMTEEEEKSFKGKTFNINLPLSGDPTAKVKAGDLPLSNISAGDLPGSHVSTGDLPLSKLDLSLAPILTLAPQFAYEKTQGPTMNQGVAFEKIAGMGLLAGALYLVLR